MNGESTSMVLLRRLLLAGLIGVVSWYAIDVLYNTIIWQITGGHEVLGRYGRDKSLSNMVVEFPWVITIILISFLFTKPRVDKKWLRKYLCLLIPLLTILSVIVPGLGE
jgi:hypothetical protein